jgi:GWxTD domain-containing protein
LKLDRTGRDLFIDAFWKQRDPTPGTPGNEFKTEHARRLAHADRYLGRDAPRPGRRTDRGRIYVILGEPNDTQSFIGTSSIYDTEVWFYQGKTDLGLPAGFYVVFFREGGRGEYRLYSPVADGPQALLAGYFGGSDFGAAYEKLRGVEPGTAPICCPHSRRIGGDLRAAVDVLRSSPSAHRFRPDPRRRSQVRPEIP